MKQPPIELFGPDWEADMMKLTKKKLIELYKKTQQQKIRGKMKILKN